MSVPDHRTQTLERIHIDDVTIFVVEFDGLISAAASGMEADWQLRRLDGSP